MPGEEFHPEIPKDDQLQNGPYLEELRKTVGPPGGEQAAVGEAESAAEAPAYAEHVDDPTHPAGNEDLAHNMANVEKPTRDMAAHHSKVAEVLRDGAEGSRELGLSDAAEQQLDNASYHEDEAKKLGYIADMSGEAARQNYIADHSELTQPDESDHSSEGDFEISREDQVKFKEILEERSRLTGERDNINSRLDELEKELRTHINKVLGKDQ